MAAIMSLSVDVIDAFDPERRVSVGRVNLADSLCRPGRLRRSDVHETILEAAELLQEHAPFKEGTIQTCYETISDAVTKCGEAGTMTAPLDNGATLRVKTGPFTPQNAQ